MPAASSKSCTAIVFAILSAIGWICFVAAYGVDRDDNGGLKNLKFQSNDFCYWALAIAGVPGILLLLAYSCSPGKFLGTLSLLFNLFMLTVSGGILNITGSAIASCIEASSINDCIINPLSNSSFTGGIHRYEQAEFSGALMYSFFQALSQCVFFYHVHSHSDYGSVA